MIVRNVLLLSRSDSSDPSIQAIYSFNTALRGSTCSRSRVETASMRRVSCGRMSGAQRSEIHACCSLSIAEPCSASADVLSKGSAAKSSSTSMSIADMMLNCRRESIERLARFSAARFRILDSSDSSPDASDELWMSHLWKGFGSLRSKEYILVTSGVLRLGEIHPRSWMTLFLPYLAVEQGKRAIDWPNSDVIRIVLLDSVSLMQTKK
jgi:hypothetical protein